MAEITSEIIDGVKVWQVPKGKLAEASDNFSAMIKAIYDRAIEEGIERTGNPDFKLSSKEISALRHHPDLGMWFSGKTPLAVDSVNAFLTKTPIGAKKILKKKLNLIIPKDTANTFGRKFFENIDNAPKEFTDWLDRLEGISKKGTFWPKGMSFKGFKKYIAQKGYKATLDLNKALEAKLGFKFDVGHLWGALGGKGERTLVGELGARIEGKFSPQNVAPQPRALTLKQLLDPTYNVFTPNVPPFFSKAGYQIAGSQELLDVYGGGQGWSSSFADYLLSESPNIEKLGDLGPREVGYIAFADPTYGDFIGKNPEARYAQMFDPGIRDDIFRQVGELAETAEEFSPAARNIPVDSPGWWRRMLQMFDKDTVTAMRIRWLASNMKQPGLRSVVPAVGIGLNLLNLKSKTKAYEEDPTLSRWVQKQAARAETALEGAEVATAGAVAPVTTPIQLGLGALDLGIDSAREGRQRGDAKMSLIGDIPGTESYEKFNVQGLFEKGSITEQSLMKSTRIQKNGVSQMTSSDPAKDVTIADNRAITNPAMDKKLKNLNLSVDDLIQREEKMRGIKGGTGWRETFGVKKG